MGPPLTWAWGESRIQSSNSPHPTHLGGLMPVDRERDSSSGLSRRRFLGMFSLGAAGIAGAGLLLKGFLLPGGNGENAPSDEFPGEDSIFHPKNDPRSDPRGKG